MKPIDTMLILAYASLPMSVLIAMGLRSIHAPVVFQIAVIVIGVLLSMLTGALCWAARMGEEMP